MEEQRRSFFKRFFFLVALGLCFMQAFFGCSEQGLLFPAVHRLIVVASLVAERRL